MGRCAFGAALAATPAHACPACFSASGPAVLTTYLLTGGLMTLLPLGIVAVLALWVRGRVRAAARASAAHSSQA
jgi:hypothetical protein